MLDVRTAEAFKAALDGHIGTCTKEMGREVYDALMAKGIGEKDARAWAQKVAAKFGKLKTPTDEQLRKDPDAELDIQQLAHFSPGERAAIDRLVETLAAEKREPTHAELELLQHENTAVDIALFGRMLAADPGFNVEAAAQVAHAVSVHAVAVEDDFFTAVDDLNRGQEDLGAGHMGETEFGAAVFYLYVCVNRDQLVHNLPGDAALADKALGALVEAAAKVPPGGKQASFGSRAYASYLLAEKGAQQPRSLSVAFLEPVRGRNLLTEAIGVLEDTRARMDRAYGACSDEHRIMNVESGDGTLADIRTFVTE